MAPPSQAAAVLSLGSINADFQARVDGVPRPGETTIASDFVRLSGGKAANTAFLANRLGVPSRLFGRVGGDRLRVQALRPLRDVSIDLSGVSVARNSATGVAMIAVTPDGEKSIVLATNANDAWAKADGEAVAARIAAAPDGSVLVVDCEIPDFVVQVSIEAAGKRGFRTVLDPSPATRVRPHMLVRISAVTPNPKEAESLTGITVTDFSSAAECAQRLAGHGAGMVFVKLGEGGCLAWRDGTAMAIPPIRMDVVDTTGAGDAFAGALAVALLEDRDLLGAGCFAVAASHLAVTGYGSQSSYPTRQEVEALAIRLAAGAHEWP